MIRAQSGLTSRLALVLLATTIWLSPSPARVLVVPIHRRGASWIATPSLSSANGTYGLTITLIRGGRGQWLVDAVTLQ